MQTSSSKKWITPVAIVAGLILVLILSSREVKGPEGIGVVGSPDDYAKAIQLAHEMTKPIFDKADNGDELTNAEKAKLLEAAVLIDNANRFLPDRTIPFLGAGKAYLLAGDLGTAEVRFRQAINNAQFDKSVGAKESGVEATFRLSQTRFQMTDYQGAFDAADAAVKAEPNGVEYLIARARALIQLKKYKQADADIHAVARLEPTNKDAAALHKLLESEDPGQFPKGTTH